MINETSKLTGNDPSTRSLKASKSLRVFNLPEHVIDKQLEELFSPYGTISNVRVAFDFISKKSRGFAYVYFENESDAIKARDAINNSEFHERQIKVDFNFVERSHEKSFVPPTSLSTSSFSSAGHSSSKTPFGATNQYYHHYQHYEKTSLSHHHHHQQDVQYKVQRSTFKHHHSYNHEQQQQHRHHQSKNNVHRHDYNTDDKVDGKIGATKTSADSKNEMTMMMTNDRNLNSRQNNCNYENHRHHDGNTQKEFRRYEKSSAFPASLEKHQTANASSFQRTSHSPGCYEQQKSEQSRFYQKQTSLVDNRRLSSPQTPPIIGSASPSALFEKSSNYRQNYRRFPVQQHLHHPQYQEHSDNAKRMKEQRYRERSYSPPLPTRPISPRAPQHHRGHFKFSRGASHRALSITPPPVNHLQNLYSSPHPTETRSRQYHGEQFSKESPPPSHSTSNNYSRQHHKHAFEASSPPPPNETYHHRQHPPHSLIRTTEEMPFRGRRPYRGGADHGKFSSASHRYHPYRQHEFTPNSSPPNSHHSHTQHQHYAHQGEILRRKQFSPSPPPSSRHHESQQSRIQYSSNYIQKSEISSIKNSMQKEFSEISGHHNPQQNKYSYGRKRAVSHSPSKKSSANDALSPIKNLNRAEKEEGEDVDDVGSVSNSSIHKNSSILTNNEAKNCAQSPISYPKEDSPNLNFHRKQYFHKTSEQVNTFTHKIDSSMLKVSQDRVKYEDDETQRFYHRQYRGPNDRDRQQEQDYYRQKNPHPSSSEHFERSGDASYKYYSDPSNRKVILSPHQDLKIEIDQSETERPYSKSYNLRGGYSYQRGAQSSRFGTRGQRRPYYRKPYQNDNSF